MNQLNPKPEPPGTSRRWLASVALVAFVGCAGSGDDPAASTNNVEAEPSATSSMPTNSAMVSTTPTLTSTTPGATGPTGTAGSAGGGAGGSGAGGSGAGGVEPSASFGGNGGAGGAGASGGSGRGADDVAGAGGGPVSLGGAGGIGTSGRGGAGGSSAGTSGMGGEGGSAAEAYTFEQVQMFMLTWNCRGCHEGSDGPDPKYPREAAELHTYLLSFVAPDCGDGGQTLVVPRDPDNSGIVSALEGTCSEEVPKMPPMEFGPSPEEVAGVRGWVRNGALE